MPSFNVYAVFILAQFSRYQKLTWSHFCFKEKETAEKYHKITRKSVQEKKENHRLSLNVEALELKLEEAEFTQSMHMDSR